MNIIQFFAKMLLAGVLMMACKGLTPIPADMSPTTRDPEPLEVVSAFHAAINRNDIEIALALFAEDALVTDNGTMSKGMEQIRDWGQHLHMPAALHLEMISFQVNGEKVYWSDLAHDKAGSGNDFHILRWNAVIQDGKIKSLVVRLLLMPDGK